MIDAPKLREGAAVLRALADQLDRLAVQAEQNPAASVVANAMAKKLVAGALSRLMKYASDA